MTNITINRSEQDDTISCTITTATGSCSADVNGVAVTLPWDEIVEAAQTIVSVARLDAPLEEEAVVSHGRATGNADGTITLHLGGTITSQEGHELLADLIGILEI